MSILKGTQDDDLTLKYLLQENKSDKVSKSGDTMTGSLILNDSKLTSGSAETVWGDTRVILCDHNGVPFGYLQGYTQNGRNGVQFTATRNVNGADYSHGVLLGIDSSGNRSVYFHDADAWLNAINAVSKSGDTMTGRLDIATGNSYGIYLKNTEMEAGVTPSSSQYKYINFKDKNDNDIAVIYSRINTSGNMALRVGAHVGSTYNTVTFTITPSNTLGINLDAPEAWCDALGYESITTISSVATAASGFSIGSASYKRWGRMVQLNISVERTGAAITSSANYQVFTLKSGLYLPVSAISTGVNTGNLPYGTLNTSGVCTERVDSWAKNTSYSIRCVYIGA